MKRKAKVSQSKTKSEGAPQSPPSQRARVSEGDSAPAVETLTKVQRIDHIIRMMVDGEWVTGKSAPRLAKEWNLSTNTIERDSAEASRRIRDLVTPQEREELKARYLAKLEGVLARALESGKFEAAKGILELEGKALGHFEPEKVEVSGNLSDLLQLGLTPNSKEAS